MTDMSYNPREVVRSCRTVEVLRVEVIEGNGTNGMPVRLVTYWHERDGTLIARDDKWERSREKREQTA